jgi:hypothetical protein
MSLNSPKRKTCIRVNNRHTPPLRAACRQTRQSSITRAISAHGGTMRGGCVLTVNATRPRLEAMASSKGSYAPRSIVSRPVAGLKLDAVLWVRELVQTLMKAAAADAGLEMVTRRVGRVQCTHSCGLPAEFANIASVPSVVEAYVQLPAIGVAVLKSCA